MSEEPSTTEGNGRSQRGRFGTGNRFGRGNPHARKVVRLRSALLKSVSPDELHEVVLALLKQAKAGDVAAARELFQRLLGPPEAVDLLDRMAALEQQFKELTQRRSPSWPN